jgi:YVTN family beta-propeller protein
MSLPSRRIGILLGGLSMLAASAFAALPKAYVDNLTDNTVSVIDTAAGQVVAAVPVAAGPHGMATTPDER